jgi:hypothetical protein
MGTKAFAVILQDIRDGRVHAELTNTMEELLTSVKETGKGGSITLKLTIKPARRGTDVDKVVITDSITASVPQHDRGEDFYWLTDDNDLSRNHPRQTTLDLREAGSPQPTALKEASK